MNNFCWLGNNGAKVSKMHTVGGGELWRDIFLIGGFSHVWQFVTEGWEGVKFGEESDIFFECPLLPRQNKTHLTVEYNIMYTLMYILKSSVWDIQAMSCHVFVIKENFKQVWKCPHSTDMHTVIETKYRWCNLIDSLVLNLVIIVLFIMCFCVCFSAHDIILIYTVSFSFCQFHFSCQ